MEQRAMPLVGNGQGDAIRASDADREATGELLRRHHADGRLADEEFEVRLGQSLSAKTFGELRALVSDLPAEQPAPERRAGWRARGPFRPGFLPALVALAILLGAFWRQAVWYGGVPRYALPWPFILAAIVGVAILRHRWRGDRRRWRGA
jgi:hypothetical protein